MTPSNLELLQVVCRILASSAGMLQAYINQEKQKVKETPAAQSLPK